MATTAQRDPSERVNWVTSIPFLLIHALPLLAIVTGVTTKALVLCAVLYFGRMFFITAGYHRYFAHRSYRLGRVMQFVMAVGGASAAQKGALWWAAHHRNHHRFADTDRDLHSPLKGFWWSHVGWILSDRYKDTDFDGIRDFAKYPELRLVEKYNWVAPWSLAIACLLYAGWSGLVVGFFLSTVLLWHGTFLVNSMAHVVGRRRYATPDTSRNSAVIALFTGGEGWHNNHHYWPASARQGFYWWEFDPTYYALKLLSVVGLVRDLRAPSRNVRELGRIDRGSFDIGMFRAYRAKALARLGAAREKAAALVARARSHGDAGADAEQAALVAKLHAEHEALEALIASSLQSAEELARLTKRARTRALA
jgi:stearoyl-CoA desaturase (delta-9 desaturase)